jgi:hypothetical protein
MHSYRTLISFLTAAALIMFLAAMATPAAAGVLDVTCVPPSSQTTVFTPPLTNRPRPVTVTASTQYGPCISPSVPGLTSGSRSATVSYPSRSCLDLLKSSSLTFTITWNTGQKSTISANTTASVVGVALVVTIAGNVTSGLFAGDSVIQTVTGPATDVTLCTLGLGTVSSIYSLVTLEITPVS